MPACLTANKPATVLVHCSAFFSPLVGVIGTTQAAEALKVLIGIGTPSHGKLSTYNALSGKWQQYGVRRNPECPVCSGR